MLLLGHDLGGSLECTDNLLEFVKCFCLVKQVSRDGRNSAKTRSNLCLSVLVHLFAYSVSVFLSVLVHLREVVK